MKLSFYNPYSKALYTTSPNALIGLYVLISAGNQLFRFSGIICYTKAGCAGTRNKIPTSFLSWDVLADLRTHGHLVDPTAIAVEIKPDLEAFKHEMMSTILYIFYVLEA